MFLTIVKNTNKFNSNVSSTFEFITTQFYLMERTKEAIWRNNNVSK